ncbi:Urease operon transcriptional activator [Symmachiella macrocystis]|uniref:Urease operon transcriptional activator n=1 Tax=Symmachiella macrocystis TaxID=2527985 RepID=A0A5C6BQ36_9PLAN|nr:AraC family transcriptional regulator [Symmachiella macrocystis]TWU13336.1 Urease operon transcriptional activator [Symmachiella macrocystis]
MQIIPLVRAKYVYAYGAVLDRLGAPRRRLLERVGLSERVLEDPEAIIPAHQAWGFIGSAAQSEGIDDLGLAAGDISIQDYGAFSEQLLQMPNLNQALEAFCQLALHEYSRADFYVSRSERGTWFCRGPIDGEEAEKKHVELLVLTMMIATVRLAAGPDWNPLTVFLQTKDSNRVEQHHLFSNSTVRFGSQVTAFEVPQHLLPQQLHPKVFPQDDQKYNRLKHEFSVAIRQVVGGMLCNGAPKIQLVADAVGESVRTLQRRLSEIDATFSGILEEARMQSAQNMIAQSDYKLKEIAHRLGYSDQAHFTRAFRRWTGVSPSTFRTGKAQTDAVSLKPRRPR